MDDTLPQQLVRQVAGSFKLTTLLQKRVRELVRGQKPLFETRERNFIRIAAEELRRGLIDLAPEEEGATPPVEIPAPKCRGEKEKTERNRMRDD